MTNLKIYAVETVTIDDERNVEFLDRCPIFIEELREQVRDGEMSWFSVRYGYLNGGDSIELANPEFTDPVLKDHLANAN